MINLASSSFQILPSASSSSFFFFFPFFYYETFFWVEGGGDFFKSINNSCYLVVFLIREIMACVIFFYYVGNETDHWFCSCPYGNCGRIQVNKQAGSNEKRVTWLKAVKKSNTRLWGTSFIWFLCILLSSGKSLPEKLIKSVRFSNSSDFRDVFSTFFFLSKPLHKEWTKSNNYWVR